MYFTVTGDWPAVAIGGASGAVQHATSKRERTKRFLPSHRADGEMGVEVDGAGVGGGGGEGEEAADGWLNPPRNC